MSQEPVNPIQVEKFLKGLDYPVDKQELIEYANEHGADKNIREALNHLPDETFNKPTDISKAISQLNKSKR